MGITIKVTALANFMHGDKEVHKGQTLDIEERLAKSLINNLIVREAIVPDINTISNPPADPPADPLGDDTNDDDATGAPQQTQKQKGQGHEAKENTSN